MGQIEYTNQLRKYVRSLHTNKYRQKYDKFIAEGPKVCNEFIISNKYPINYIFCTDDWYQMNFSELDKDLQLKVILIKEKELSQISSFKTANKVLLVLERTVGIFTDYDSVNWELYLDTIQDPGNMGTIIRIADWYGIKNIYTSKNCVDVYSPKVIQSAMGGHNRTLMSVKDYGFLANYTKPIYGLELGGIDINTLDNPKPGLIAIGNESHGFSEDAKANLTYRLMIPRLGGAESLNAAVACGIACHQLVTSS